MYMHVYESPFPLTWKRVRWLISVATSSAWNPLMSVSHGLCQHVKSHTRDTGYIKRAASPGLTIAALVGTVIVAGAKRAKLRRSSCKGSHIPGHLVTGPISIQMHN